MHAGLRGVAVQPIRKHWDYDLTSAERRIMGQGNYVHVEEDGKLQLGVPPTTCCRVHRWYRGQPFNGPKNVQCPDSSFSPSFLELVKTLKSFGPNPASFRGENSCPTEAGYVNPQGSYKLCPESLYLNPRTLMINP